MWSVSCASSTRRASSRACLSLGCRAGACATASSKAVTSATRASVSDTVAMVTSGLG